MATWFLYESSNEKHLLLWKVEDDKDWMPEIGDEVPEEVCPWFRDEGEKGKVVYVIEGEHAELLHDIDTLDEIFGSASENHAMYIRVIELMNACLKIQQKKLAV